ncbi:MAG: MarR family winged helix-turn-helix transcriptional regulator [Oscillospiraceae bacterium]|jgi:DNA-binding MarR family transcriptional regulator
MKYRQPIKEPLKGPGMDLRFNNADPHAMEMYLELLNYHKLQNKMFYTVVASKELFHAQMMYLKVISEHEGLNQRDLAEHIGVERASATTALQRMEKAELIERRPDSYDRRMTRIYLSEKGRQISAEMDKEHEAFINACFKFSKERTEQFVKTLELVNQNMREYLIARKKEQQTEKEKSQE